LNDQIKDGEVGRTC